MHDRDAVVAATDLVTLADSLVGPSTPGPAGATWRCPDGGHAARSDEPPQFVVYRTRRGDQRWQCTSCGAGGTAIELVATATGGDIGAALNVLARRLVADGAPLSPPTGDSESGPHPASAARSVDRWVGRAAELLWSPFGDPVRRWLAEDRGLSEDLLRFHRLGATSVTASGRLPTRRPVPGRRASSLVAVLPVRVRGRAVRAQLRLVDPPSPGERYANPPSLGGAGNSVGLFRPPRRRYPEILVTEGILDALAANAAGYRAAAVLTPARADASVAHQLASLEGPLVLSFDPDEAGNAASRRLAALLTARGRSPATLALPGGDLNESLVAAGNWPRWLDAHVGQAVADVAAMPPGRGL